jgi:hypothetical protein
MSPSDRGQEFNQLGMPIGKVLTSRRPDEISAPITKEEFLTLCEGEISGAKQRREICRDLFIASLIGLVSLLANVDWGNFGKRQNGWVFFVSAIAFLGATAGFGAGWAIYRALSEKNKGSHYSRVKGKLESDFQTTEKIIAASAAHGSGNESAGRLDLPDSKEGGQVGSV